MQQSSNLKQPDAAQTDTPLVCDNIVANSDMVDTNAIRAKKRPNTEAINNGAHNTNNKKINSKVDTSINQLKKHTNTNINNINNKVKKDANMSTHRTNIKSKDINGKTALDTTRLNSSSLNTNQLNVNQLNGNKTISTQPSPYAGQRSFTQIPTQRPSTPLLDTIDSPADLKPLTTFELITLADELREFLLYSAGISGGHFGANLGVVELTLALHYLYDLPKDKLVWDVGHQAYAHKALTGRRDQLSSIRAKKGLTAFPERGESEYDSFGVGHSSTAISAGLGMSLAMAYQGSDAKVACIVGDGAMTGGMAFEAMNDAVHQDADLTVILNDNDMSISCAVGGFCQHLAQLWESGYQVDISDDGEPKLTQRPNIPLADRRARHYQMDNKAEGNEAEDNEENELDGRKAQTQDTKSLFDPNTKIGDNLFKAIGFQYFGPFDGHNLPELLRVIGHARNIKGPLLIHVYTTKGKGFTPAEMDPIGYHAVAKLSTNSKSSTTDTEINKATPTLKYSQVFGQFICDKADVDSKLMAITPAMEMGSGMTDFAHQYPKQFFDVAIAEQHAVTVAGGMATQGVKPIVAIYSTFLQRGYDQLIHDIALQELDVMFAIDRAGLVGEDGATHAGVFDLAFMRCVPNMVIATPKDENECYHLLNTCYEYNGPTAVRYPRGAGTGALITKPAQEYEIGKAVIEAVYKANPTSVTDSKANTKTHTARLNDLNLRPIKLALLAFGPMVATANKVAEQLIASSATVCNTAQPIQDITVINMRWVKPLDTQMIDELLSSGISHIVTLEEHAMMGGAGSAVSEYLVNSQSASSPVLSTVSIKNIGIPDRFIEQGSHAEQLAECQLDAKGIINQLQGWL